jgi:hypothetical protein
MLWKAAARFGSQGCGVERRAEPIEARLRSRKTSRAASFCRRGGATFRRNSINSLFWKRDMFSIKVFSPVALDANSHVGGALAFSLNGEAWSMSRVMREVCDMNWRFLMVSVLGAVLLLFASPRAHAEGGAGPEAMTMGNMCMVMFGYDMVHITAYQPGKSRSEYCEEIPTTGKTILVFDIDNPKFRDMPIEVRIIRDPSVPLRPDTDLAALTELHLPPRLYRTGTFNVEHDFSKEGHYIGIVTLTRDNGEKESGQFKFSVGQTLWMYLPVILGVVLIGLLVLAYWRHSHPNPRKTTPIASS